MGTIDKNIFEISGARGCGISDYTLVLTSYCNSYLVKDDELQEVYFDVEGTKDMPN